MTVRDPQGHEVQQTLQNQAQTTPLGEVTAVSALHKSTVPNVLQLTAKAQLEQIPGNAQVTLSWTVSDASGKIVDHNNQILAAADVTPGEHTYSWSPSITDPGTYTARSSLAIVTGDGVLQAGQASSSSTTFNVDNPPDKCNGVCK
jgi:hypothetical protein